MQKANTPSVVQVALQVPLPEGKEILGGRLISKFPSDMSLWSLMRQFESGQASAGRNINITARGVAQTSGGTGAGQLYYETPVLNLMGREISTLTDFQKTLSQLGYNSGSVLMRLSFKRTDQTLFDAMEEIGTYFKDDGVKKNETEKATAQETSTIIKDPPHDAPTAEVTTTQPTNDIKPEEATSISPREQGQLETEVPNDAMDIDMTPSDPLKPLNVFLAPTSETPVAAQMPRNDSDYTPTVAHAQLHQARLLESSRNKRLLSDRELEEKAAAEEAKVAAVKVVIVKVRFPDNTSSDWQVGPSETGSFLYKAVRHVMADNEQPFKLLLPGGKAVIQDADGPSHTLIRGYKMAGKILINLVWDDAVPSQVRKQPFLKGSIAQQGQAVKVQEVPDAKDEPGEAAPVVKKPEKEDKGEGGVGKKIPKWLKLGKK